MHRFKDRNLAPISFIGFRGLQNIFKNIHDSDIDLEDVEKDQKRLKSDLVHINQGPKKQNKEQLDTTENIRNP